MEKVVFGASKTQSVALILKDTIAGIANKADIISKYLLPLSKATGMMMANEVCILPAYYPKTGNLKKKDMVDASLELLELCDVDGIGTLLVADSKYFEHLTGAKGLERQIGKVFDCVIAEYVHLKILPVLSYITINMYPEKKILQTKAFARVSAELNGEEVVEEVFKFKDYRVLTHPSELDELLDKPILAIDIETTGLRFESCELVTIAFAWSDTEAVTIPIHRSLQDTNGGHREQVWKDHLKTFFERYEGTKIFHNYLFDGKFLVRHLFMDGPLDYKGRSYGAKVMDSEDSMIVAYLCLNSTSRISLSLKDLAYDYVGEYAVGVKDVLLLEPEVLYKYNAMDVVATFWVWEKYIALLVIEDQVEPYRNILQPSLNYLLNMMLSGLPLSKERITEATTEIGKVYDDAMKKLQTNEYVKLTMRQLRIDAADKYNAKTKVKKKTPGDFMDLVFNPNSTLQLRALLFSIMDYTPIDYTPKKEPKTNRDSILEFKDAEHQVERLEVLDALIHISQTGIILSTFLKTFDDLWFDVGDDDLGRLYGNQRLGGTVTGRLSSNSPNFANMPSGSEYGKAIKGCFVAPEGYLFCGSDYAALEDRVGAQITGDENKRKEFLHGFDGHSLRAYAFFKDEIDEALGEDLDVTDPTSINRIKDELPKIRAKSKSPSFAMAYGSGAGKIKDLLKCTKEEAENVFNMYHKLYQGTADYAVKNIKRAEIDKFVIGAYGIKLRTPRINSNDKGIASSEGRTLNNMSIQSYGLLTNEAGIGIQKRIEADGLEDDIIIINQIHDAIYILVKKDPKIISWLNKNLIEVMVKDYVEDQVIHNAAELDIGPTWATQVTLKNDASIEDIQEVLSSF